jgi:hypothetical protein
LHEPDDEPDEASHGRIVRQSLRASSSAQGPAGPGPSVQIQGDDAVPKRDESCLDRDRAPSVLSKLPT